MYVDLFHCCISTDIDDLFEVQSELQDVTHRWKGLGKALRLRPALLSKIEADRPDSESRLEEILTQWLQQAYNSRELQSSRRGSRRGWH